MSVPGASSTVSRVARNAGWSLAAEFLRLVTSTTVFIILTYRFEPARYGSLVAALALLSFLLPQATLGASYLVLQRVAGQGWDPQVAIRRALGAALGGGVAVTLVLVAVRGVVLPQVSLATIAILGVSELVLTGMMETVVFLAQAQERLGALAAARAVFGLSRLGAGIVLLLVTTRPSLWHWAALSSASTLIGALVAQRLVIGRFVVPHRPTRLDVREGIPFSVGFGADKLRDSIDSVLLVRLDRRADAGLYGAAMRIVGMSTVPITALIQALNARFFREGHSPRAARALAVRATGAGMAVAVPIGLVFATIGDQIVRVLPQEYRETGPVLQMMAVLPALIVLEVFPAMALTAIGRHRTRVVFNLVTAALNLVLDLWWIPDHGWRGAVVATIISASAYIVVLWGALGLEVRRSTTREVPA